MTNAYKVRTITCDGCGNVVTKRLRPKARFCSHECYARSPKPSRKTGQLKVCKRCDSEFYVPKSRVEKGEGSYCSLDCWNQDQGNGKTEHQCETCKATFRWSPSRSESGKYNIRYCSLACRDADPSRKQMLLEMNQNQQSGKMTRIERVGYSLLDQLNVEYLPQANFANKFTPDAVIESSKLVIQFDGDYWHDKSGKNVEPRIVRRVALDKSQDKYINSCGWTVLRLWESDLMSNPDKCKELIIAALMNGQRDSSDRNPIIY